MRYYHYDSAIGKITIAENNHKIVKVVFGEKVFGEHYETDLIKEAWRQLQEYFDGKRKCFELPLETGGTAFHKKVWDALQTIPYGEIRTYGQIAAQIGNPKASRAVGMANHNNPISVIIPCHRVVGSNGKLTGYAGGLNNKQLLLNLEKEQVVY